MAINLVEKMGRKHDVTFKMGRLDIWASAIIYCRAQINFLFDKGSQYYLSADDICDYFGTKKSTVSKKASLISDIFNLSPLNNEFILKNDIGDLLKSVEENDVLKYYDVAFDDFELDFIKNRKEEVKEYIIDFLNGKEVYIH